MLQHTRVEFEAVHLLKKARHPLRAFVNAWSRNSQLGKSKLQTSEVSYGYNGIAGIAARPTVGWCGVRGGKDVICMAVVIFMPL